MSCVRPADSAGMAVGRSSGTLLHFECFLAECDTAIRALITEQPCCTSCLADKVGIEPHAVEASVTRIETEIAVFTQTGPCAICATVGPVVSVARP